jgi:glycosyltransferase involved in cell wall biosynthesis
LIIKRDGSSVFDVAVVVPAWQKSDSIGPVLESVITLLEALHKTFEIIVVVDGPDRETFLSASAIKDERVMVIQLEQNSGKGNALRKGVEISGSRYVAFVDADMDIDISALGFAIHKIEQADDLNLSCVYGSKVHLESKVDYPLSRRLLSRIHRTLVSKLFNVSVEDSQTGLKLFRSDALKSVLTYSFQNGFLFDLEIFVLLSRRGLTFLAIPIEINFKFSSTVNIFSIWRIFLDTVRLGRAVNKPFNNQ